LRHYNRISAIRLASAVLTNFNSFNRFNVSLGRRFG